MARMDTQKGEGVAAPVAAPEREQPLVPILVDYFTRDGSTLMMRLLNTSPHIVVGEPYPFERKYFVYLFRWARLLDRREWPKRWVGRSFGSLTQEERTPLMGPLRGFREICCAHPAASRRCRSTASTWHGGSSRTVPGRSKGIERASATTPRSTWTRGSSTWRSCHRSRSSSCFATPVTPISRSGHSTGSGASLATRAYDVARGLQSREDRLDWFIDRQRDRMRWIHDLLRSDEVP